MSSSSKTDCERPSLSICVIGRNQSSTLRKCAESLARLRRSITRLETIYVDSASTDESVEYARTIFDAVIELAPSAHLNASAGRWAGSRVASGQWILFLDGDMEIRAEFESVLVEYAAGRGRGDGIVGPTINVYPDGGTRPIHFPGNVDSLPCRMFGGAVLLSAGALQAAGSWNPRLYSNEEMELYGRLRARGAEVYWTSTPMVFHHTERISKWRMLRGSFWPYGSVLGKKFFGPGQVLIAGLREGTLGSFLRVRAGLATFLACGVLAIVALALGFRWLAGVLVAVAVGFAFRHGGTKGPVIYSTWIPQILFGIWRYPGGFEPQVRSTTWRSGPKIQSSSPSGEGSANASPRR